MAVLTISAVTPASDTLTITAHGLNNGDGPVAIYTPNGTIPGGLAAATDYWAIVQDANTVKLATSSTNALAGTAIDITDAGSGTLDLLVGLPYRRARTYAVGSQLKSVDLNSLQDSLIALWNFVTGQAQSIFGDLVLAANKRLKLSGTGDVSHGNYTLPMASAGGAGTMSYNSAAAFSTAAGQRWYMPLRLLPGDRIRAGGLQFTHLRSGGTVIMSLAEYDVATGTLTSTPYSATDTTTIVTVQSNIAGSDYTLLAGKFYLLSYQAGGASDNFEGVTVTYDRP